MELLKCLLKPFPIDIFGILNVQSVVIKIKHIIDPSWVVFILLLLPVTSRHDKYSIPESEFLRKKQLGSNKWLFFILGSPYESKLFILLSHTLRSQKWNYICRVFAFSQYYKHFFIFVNCNNFVIDMLIGQFLNNLIQLLIKLPNAFIIPVPLLLYLYAV